MKLVAALLLVLCIALPARADVGGPKAGMKLVPVTTVVEAAESFPDHAFFEISYSSRPGPPPHGGSSRSVTLHFFVKGTTIKATGAPRSGGSLYVVPQAVAERFPGWSEYAADAAKQNPAKHMTVSTSDAQWFTLAQSVRNGEVPGASTVPFGTTQEVPAADPREAITVNYRITRSSAGVTFVRPDEAEQNRSWSETLPAEWESPFPWRWVAVGGAGFAAILLGGLWLARRSRKAA